MRQFAPFMPALLLTAVCNCSGGSQESRSPQDLGIISCAILNRVSPYDVAALTQQPVEVVEKVRATCGLVVAINESLQGLPLAGGPQATATPTSAAGTGGL